MKSRSILIVAVSAILIAGCGKTTNSPSTNGSSGIGRPAAATPDEFAATRALFDKNCSECHQKTGEGGPVKLKDGTKLKVPNLRAGHALHHPDSDFIKQITKGGDGMPAFRDKLKSDEINDLVRFVRHEFQGGVTPPTEPMKPMKGMK